MAPEVAYIPGSLPAISSPLARFLPFLPEGVLTTWLKANIPPGGWVLDPFGASPRLAVEAALAGYRVVVASNNPIDRYMLDITANPPREDELRAALATIGASFKGGQRLEPHIRSLYTTVCGECGQELMAEAFIWDRSAPAHSHRIYHCTNCNDSGERPITKQDEIRAAQFGTSGLHRARALERVAPPDDPDRPYFEEAVDVYQPRAIYALFTLLNKLESHPAHLIRPLSALLLTVFDRANSLWPHPPMHTRPRQLSIHGHFYEFNIWLQMEQAVEQIAKLQNILTRQVPLCHWPEQPPPEGGISIFAGRMRDFSALGYPIRFDAVATGIPRYNQAYWTLSALWAGWLWGQEQAASFKSVLRRRRYDWAWHCSALHASLLKLADLLEIGTPILALIGEAEPGYLCAAILAHQLAGIELSGLAVRADQNQAQLHFHCARRVQIQPETAEAGEISSETAVEVNNQIRDLSQKATHEFLRQRSEPAAYLTLYTTALAALAGTPLLNPEQAISTSELFNQVQNAIQQTFSYHSGFVHYASSSRSPESGHWWLKEAELSQLEGVEEGKAIRSIEQEYPPLTTPPLSDLVEMDVVRYLQKHPGCDINQLDREICAEFPGMMTPDLELVVTCLESYGNQIPPNSRLWELRIQDTPKARRADLALITGFLEQIGQRLGFYTSRPLPEIRLITWGEPDGTIKYAFYLVASAVLGNIVSTSIYPPEQCLIVYPGGRAGLIAYKLKTNPRLKQYIDQGWRLIKFRHVHRLAESKTLNRDNLDEELALDPLTQQVSQLIL